MRCALVLLLLCVFHLPAAPAGGMLADYAGIITEDRPRADGHRHLDTPALIAKLRTLHANTYFYLVHGALEWEDFTNEFLPAAAKAGLDVWLYFVPPSECTSCSLPLAISSAIFRQTSQWEFP